MRTIGFLITATLASSVLTATPDMNCRWSTFKTDDKGGVNKPAEAEDYAACNDGKSPQVYPDCDLTFKCDQGEGREGTSDSNPYFFKDDPEGKGIVASCRNGQWTFKGRHSHLTAMPQCYPACPALTRDDMVNATYVSEQPKESATYRIRGKYYWLAGTIVETKCKPGFTFTNLAFDARGTDKHECRVPGKGSAFWYDMVSDVKNPTYGKPGVCMATCKLLDIKNLPSDIELKTNPETLQNSYRILENGEKVLLFGSAYQFRCKNGKNFTNPGYGEEQSIICKGGEGGWYDEVSKSSDAKPASCSSPGCPQLTSSNLVPHANSEYDQVCKNKDGVMVDGCEVTIKCAKTDGTSSGRGYIMQGKPNGHKLFCKDAKWVDETGAEVKPDSGNRFGGECVGGCAKLSDSQKGKTEVTSQPDSSNRNDDMEFVSIGSKMDTKCKDSYIRPGTSTQPGGTDSYQCTDNGWGNIDSSQTGNKHPANCVGACPVPPESTGTKYIIKGQVTTKNGVKYLQEGGSAEATCEDKFTQPKNQPSNSQKLTCSGGNNGWMDGSSNKTGQSVLVCVKDGAAGCPIVNPQTNPNTVVTTEGDCTPSEGMLPENCKIAVTCQPGFIPETSTSVSGNGSQILQCKAGHDGYQDSTNGQKNVSPLKCIAGCELIKDMRTATYSKAPQTSDIIKYGDKEYLRKDAEVIIKCKEGFEFVHADDYNRRNPELKYFCKGGDEKYIKPFTGEYNKVPGDGCGGVCEALTTNLIGTEVTPFNSNSGVSFIKAGKKMVVGYQYTVKCRKGFEYPRSSAPAQKGYQKLGCLGGSDGYMDLESNATNSMVTQLPKKLIECIPIEEPSCPNLSISPSTENTEVVPTSGNCTIVGTKVPLGCAINLKCKEGFFRASTGAMSPPSLQPLKCVINANGEAEWVGGTDNNPANLLKCTYGCPDFDENNPKIIVWESAMKISDGKTQYFKDGVYLSVKCAENLVGKLKDGSASPKDYEFKYRCSSGTPGKPWKTIELDRYEESPGITCSKPCDGLSTRIPEGVVLRQGPAETETGTNKITTGGSIYEFDCMPGYRIDASNRADNKSQTLICNGETGKYQDLTNKNLTTSEPIKCIRIVGAGCSDVFQNTNLTSRTNCDKGFPDKCKVVVECKEGYIPGDTKLHTNPKQELTCVDGNDWKDASGQIYTSVNSMKCVPACKYDKSVINENSHVTKNVTIIVVGGQEYLKQGTPVPVKCKGDTVIWVKDTAETTMEHEYICRGGDSNYQSSSTNQVNVILGDGCVSTCPPLVVSNMSTTVVRSNAPKEHIQGDQRFIATGDSYEFKCAENYVYPPNSKPSVPGVEKIQCDGKTGRYVNTATGQDFTTPTECVRNPQLNDCPILAQHGNVWSQNKADCKIVDGNFYASGCKIELSCKLEHMPVNPDYHYGDGVQHLQCSNAGQGWKDQNGKVITTGLACKKGCLQPDQINSTFIHQSKSYIKDNITATCIVYANTTTPGGRDSKYRCPLPADYQENNNCTNACLAPRIAQSVAEDTSKPPARLNPDNLGYVFGNQAFVLRCIEGYRYPLNSSYHESGVQTLTCNPVTRQYDDLLNNKKNVTVQACEESDGCQVLTPGSNSGQPTEVTKCATNDGWYIDKCKLKYNCLPGFYPSDTDYLYAGGQEVTCDEKAQKWTGSNGQESKKTLDCVRGCAPVDYREMIRIFSNSATVLGFTSVKDTQGTDFTCLSMATKTELQRIIERFYSIPNAYFCPGPKNDTSVVNRFEEKSELCDNTCQALDGSPSKLPEGTTLVTAPALLDPYGSQKYTGAGNSYVFGCKDGYEPVLKQPQQVLKCQADGKYADEASGESSKVPSYMKCKKFEGCVVPAKNVTDIQIGASCGSPVNGRVKGGCEIEISCEKDSYPTERNQWKMPLQKLTCDVNQFGTYWVDTAGKRQEPMICTPGCLKPSSSISDSSSKIDININLISPAYVVRCIQTKSQFNASVPQGTAKYYCGLKTDNTTNNNLNPPACTNTCIVQFDVQEMKMFTTSSEWTAILGLKMELTDIYKTLIPIGFSATLKCNNGKFTTDISCDMNEQLTDPKTNQTVGHFYTAC